MARRLLLGLLVIGAGLQGSASPGEAASLTTAGWWWRAQTGAVGLPPPPHVPANGLSVGNAPDGPSAVAATRFALSGDESSPVLTLTVAEQFASGAVGLVACPAGSPWFGAQAGNWEDRPEARCDSAAINGVTSADGTSWTFVLAGMGAEGAVDVVILPAEGSDPFELSFEAPNAASLRTSKAPASGGPDSTGSGGEADFVPPSGSFEGGFDFGSPVTPPAPLSSEAAELEPAAEPPSTGNREFIPIARDRDPAADDTTDPRPLAVVVLLAALFIAASLGREPLPLPRLLGPMAGRREVDAPEPELRGFGRFRRPRRGEAPSLH